MERVQGKLYYSPRFDTILQTWSVLVVGFEFRRVPWQCLISPLELASPPFENPCSWSSPPVAAGTFSSGNKERNKFLLYFYHFNSYIKVNTVKLWTRVRQIFIKFIRGSYNDNEMKYNEKYNTGTHTKYTWYWVH